LLSGAQGNIDCIILKPKTLSASQVVFAVELGFAWYANESTNTQKRTQCQTQPQFIDKGKHP